MTYSVFGGTLNPTLLLCFLSLVVSCFEFLPLLPTLSLVHSVAYTQTCPFCDIISPSLGLSSSSPNSLHVTKQYIFH